MKAEADRHVKQGRETRTPDLFGPAEPADGSLNCHADLCVALNTIIDEATHRSAIRDRYDLAAAMSRYTGDTITKEMLDAWTSVGKKAWRFPFIYAAAFEAASRSYGLQQLLARKRGTRVLTGDEVALAELAALQAEKADIAAREREIKARIRRQR